MSLLQLIISALSPRKDTLSDSYGDGVWSSSVKGTLPRFHYAFFRRERASIDKHHTILGKELFH